MSVSDWESGPFVKRLVDERYGGRYTVRLRPQWTYVDRDDVQLPDHGWKLHISSRAEDFAAMAARTVPFLLEVGCSFKLASTSGVLTAMNYGIETPAGVGKAITVYPQQDRVRDLGLALVELLRGHPGPRVLSDRRIDGDAPVYYRYGPFVARWFRGQRGLMSIQIPGPHGETFDAVADLDYRQPDWVTDPFRPESDDETPELLGGRYRLEDGVQRTAQGSVFRARDTTTDRVVIVKQARAYVGDSGNGLDARSRLRNERRVLTACEGVPGVPAFIDHFAHGDDEFLVTTDVGDQDLAYRVGNQGAMLRAGTPVSPGFTQLVAQLARTLLALHTRGVVMRDITPRNVVIGADRAHLVDFGISALDGLHVPGGTHGYASWDQMRNGPATPSNDHYSLGMTLAFAATSLSPVVDETEADVPAQRALQSLTSILGPRHAPFTDLVAELLQGTPEQATAALRTLANEDWAAHTSATPRRQSMPTADPIVLEQQVLDQLLWEVEHRQLRQPASAFANVDGSIYTGSAGVGLELLHHRHQPGVPELLHQLAEHTVRANTRIDVPPGLFLGSTGSHLFLAQLRKAGFDVALPAIPAVPYNVDDEHDDIMTGTAGVGLGHLYLADVLSDPAHLDAARACVDNLLAKTEMTLSVALDAGLPEEIDTDPSASYSHGRAGVIDLLIAYTARTGDPEVRAAAQERSQELRNRADVLIGRARDPRAIPLSVSWCQGLAGIGRTLLHAAELFDASEFTAAAVSAAEACTAWIPRLGGLSQCCGLTGVGGFLIDCARHTGDDRHQRAAHAVVPQLLARSHGPDGSPLFVNSNRQDAPWSWATGNAGILAFLRRLNRPDTPEVVPYSHLPLRTAGHPADRSALVRS
ncbi:class IV lanthionine synthetase LanL [Micromonospora sp. NPDC006431]|uniref:class IV lanthionine synthetase LanL n=1 Tax=Micromonospora sp. NPDC006431 TaxID=3364235 RepID=UPI0036ACF3B8